MAVATFRAGGLASGIDSNSIIEQLMQIEARPISILKNRQNGLKAQISTLGDISSKIQALYSAADGLAKGGSLATKVDSTNTSFSAVSGSGALAGRYELQVGSLASSARTRSAPVLNSTDPLQRATLDLTVQGTDYQIEIADGSTLADVAYAIRQSGAPVTASVINDGTQHVLSIVNNTTGYPVTGPASDGLSFTLTPHPLANQTYQALALDPPTDATNATVVYNGITVTRTTNTISDVIDGVTLSLKSLTGIAEPLVLSNDQTATVANLQKFADAYNVVMKALQSQLNVSAGTDRNTVMAGDSSLRSLQSNLQQLVYKAIGTSQDVRTLADIGLKSAQDGSLSVDSATVAKVITRDPLALNRLFADAAEGVATKLKGINTNYASSSGILSSRKTTIQNRIDKYDDEILTMQTRIEKKRETLIAQFTSMESIVSKLKSTGDFLSRQSFSIDNGE
jgi:flagellar hook-associated protein 2